VVTIFLSDDATAVLTLAVYAATRTAKVEPLPYLFICAFIAHAASFVLPISNPANLVVLGDRMPTLLEWMRTFALPSVIAIIVTFLLLRFSQRESLRGGFESEGESIEMTYGAVVVALGIGTTALLLLASSALGKDLGLATFICGATVTVIVILIGRKSPLPYCRMCRGPCCRS
jgi:arsenical pump membrane protein